MDVRLVLGKDKKLSLKTEASGSDHTVTVPALVDHPWLMESNTVPATIEVVCEKYYFTPMRKHLEVEPEHVAPGPTVGMPYGPGTQPASVNPLIDSKVVKESIPSIKESSKPIVGSILESVTSTEIAKSKKQKQEADLLKALRNKK